MQLPLKFPLDRHRTFANWIDGPNRELSVRLRQPQTDGRFNGIWVWGGSGVGKTHLLQAALHAAGNQQGIYLPLRDIASAAAVEGLGSQQIVALDDLDCWSADAEKEKALFDVYQQGLQRGSLLLVASRTAPAVIDIELADLASRLRGLHCYELHALNDSDTRKVLEQRAAALGMRLQRQVVDYWFNHGKRDLGLMLEQLDRVDALSLGRGKPVSIAMLKEVLD